MGHGLSRLVMANGESTDAPSSCTAAAGWTRWFSANRAEKRRAHANAPRASGSADGDGECDGLQVVLSRTPVTALAVSEAADGVLEDELGSAVLINSSEATRV